MIVDVVAMKRSAEAEALGKKLGFQKILFSEDLQSITCVEGKNEIVNRRAVEDKKTQILLNPHQGQTADALHFRRSGVNHIVCALAYKNNVTFAFTLDHVQSPQEMGRVMQNIKLCRKYKVGMLFYSNAKTIDDMRGAQDMMALCRVLGMMPGEAKTALSGFGTKHG